MCLLKEFIETKRKYQGNDAADRTEIREVSQGFILNLPCKDGMCGEKFYAESEVRRMMADLHRAYG